MSFDCLRLKIIICSWEYITTSFKILNNLNFDFHLPMRRFNDFGKENFSSNHPSKKHHHRKDYKNKKVYNSGFKRSYDISQMNDSDLLISD